MRGGRTRGGEGEARVADRTLGIAPLRAERRRENHRALYGYTVWCMVGA